MPVSYYPVAGTVTGASAPSYLIPAPFVNVTKNYDKSGSGEILGVKYAITLTGHLIYDRGSPQSNGKFLTADAVETVGADEEYASLQGKQKAIMNLFSKENEGGLLHIENPKVGTAGFKCYPRIISVDFPSHDPGRPTISTYTITLEADQLVGPGTTYDNDDWATLNKWLISAASENWSIAENDAAKVVTFAYGAVTKTEKTYTLTRTTSATGKAKFDTTTTVAADGFQTDKFTPKYASKGEAWQQARGYVYDILKYGNVFLMDDTATNDGKRNENGINLPADYKGYNYVRSETIDELGGTFSVTENWLMIPDGHNNVTETVETSISQSQDTGLLRVSINGAIQGLGTENTDVTLPGTEAADIDVDFAEKYLNAKNRFTAIEGDIYLTAQQFLRDSNEFSVVTLNPVPVSKTIGRSPLSGIVTYALEFDNRPGFAIPNVKSETISVNDTYPGYVAAVTQVIGRPLGPVLQSVGTQSQWQRSLTIECVVDTSLQASPNFLGYPASDYYGGAIDAKPSHVPAQRAVIIDIIKKFSPGESNLVNAWFTESPSESWNPRTGAWSWSVSWVYEPQTTYQFTTGSSTDPYAPYPKTFL